MPIAVWDDSYLTGDPTVDTQHKQLFKLVNELHGTIVGGKGPEVQGPTLKRFAEYTVEHFQTEEELIAAQGYPGLAEHKAEHENLVKQVTALVKKFDHGELVLPLTLSRFLSDWITHHIQDEDKRVIDWLKAHRQPAGSTA